MRRTILIVLVLMWVQAYLLGPELMKIPVLVSHYIEHCDDEEGLSFSSFIAEHYTDAGESEDGDHDHEGLPYHHHNGAAVGAHASVFIAHAPSSSELGGASGKAIPVLPSEADILAGHTRGLIQPPRSVSA